MKAVVELKRLTRSILTAAEGSERAVLKTGLTVTTLLSISSILFERFVSTAFKGKAYHFRLQAHVTLTARHDKA